VTTCVHWDKPHLVELRIRGFDFSRFDEMHAWLDENAGVSQWAWYRLENHRLKVHFYSEEPAILFKLRYADMI
jgi:hypothetical protein